MYMYIYIYIRKHLPRATIGPAEHRRIERDNVFREQKPQTTVLASNRENRC